MLACGLAPLTSQKTTHARAWPGGGAGQPRKSCSGPCPCTRGTYTAQEGRHTHLHGLAAQQGSLKSLAAARALALGASLGSTF
eukprot:1161512-Pelagomonas_calceolata.AAC.16